MREIVPGVALDDVPRGHRRAGIVLLRHRRRRAARPAGAGAGRLRGARRRVRGAARGPPHEPPPLPAHRAGAGAVGGHRPPPRVRPVRVHAGRAGAGLRVRRPAAGQAMAMELDAIRPDETAIWFAEQRALAMADGLVREPPDGAPGFVPDRLMGDDPEGVKAACARGSRAWRSCAAQPAARARPADRRRRPGDAAAAAAG